MSMRKGYSSMISLIFSALAILSISAAVSGSAQNIYEYIDNFSDDKVKTDSHHHSDFVETPPDISLNGYLMFGCCSSSGRALGFYKGFYAGSQEAYLDYSFPLGEQQNVILSGSLEFDLVNMPVDFYYFIVDISCNEGSEGVCHTLTSPGHYAFSLEPGAECTSVDIHLHGVNVFLDNLHVTLDQGETDTEETSWGHIKAIAGQ